MRLFRTLPVIVAGLMTLGTAVPASAAIVGVSRDTAIAALKEWNVIAFNNFDSQHHVEGRILAGSLTTTNNFEAQAKNLYTSGQGTPMVTVVGNASIKNDNAKVQGSGSVIAVGGKLDTGPVGSGYVEGQNGTIKTGGASTARIRNNTFTVQQNLGSDFTATLASQASDVKQSLINLSANLKAVANTSNVTFEQTYNTNGNTSLTQNPKLTVTGTGLAVYNMSEFEFEGADVQKNINFTLPSGATLVINVAGKDLSFTGKVNQFTNDENVIWNFYEAEKINFAQQFSGTVLGVFSDITINNQGNVDGSVIGNNITQKAAEIHNQNYFQGNLSAIGTPPIVSTAPEPSTWAMLILGFGLVGAVMRRRDQRALVIQAA